MTDAHPPVYPCPCCGYLVFDEPPGSYAICPICFWEDDLAQLRFADLAWGPNRVSLREAQATYATLGACEPRLVTHVRRPAEGDRRDPDWRPLDLTRDDIEDDATVVDAARTYPDDATRLYYWRDTSWRR